MPELLSLSKFLHILRTLCLLVPYLPPECRFPASTLITFPSSLAGCIPAAFPAPVPLADPTAPCPARTPAAPAEQPSFGLTWAKTSADPQAPLHTARRRSPPSPASRPQPFPATAISRGDEGREQREAAGALRRSNGAILRGRGGGGPGARQGSALRSRQDIAVGYPPVGARRGHGAPRDGVRDGTRTGT